MQKLFIIATFQDGNVIRTRFNGTVQIATDYYLGKFFATQEGKTSKCIRVDISSAE